MKRTLCVLITICMMTALVLMSVSASGNISKSDDFSDGELILQPGTKDGTWEIQQDDGGNYYLNCKITDGQSHYDIKCDDMLEDAVYLAFDIYLEDTNYSIIEIYSTPEIGANYTLWHYGYIADGKLLSFDKTKSVDISSNVWHTVEFFFDIVNEDVHVYLDGQEAFSFNPYGEHAGETKFMYCDHLRVHMKGDGRGTAIIKLDNFKLGFYDNMGETPTTSEETTPPIVNDTTDDTTDGTADVITTDNTTENKDDTTAGIPAADDTTGHHTDTSSGLKTETVITIIAAAVAVIVVVIMVIIKKKKA